LFHNVNDFFDKSSLVAIVTEYVEGGTLADYIMSTPSTGKLPAGADIVRVFASLSLALDYAHQHGIIHGNIKPTNILLTSSASLAAGQIGEPTLTDFGLTKLLRNTGYSGSPFYLSPEQIKGSPATSSSRCI